MCIYRLITVGSYEGRKKVKTPEPPSASPIGLGADQCQDSYQSNECLPVILFSTGKKVPRG